MRLLLCALKRRARAPQLPAAGRGPSSTTRPKLQHDPPQGADVTAVDASRSALGRTDNKVITDAELAMVLDRKGGTKKGKGFLAVEKTTNSFDALNSKG